LLPMDRMDRHSTNEENCNGEMMSTDENSQSADSLKLHWNKSVERRGLGNLITKGNHIALTVSDIGRSLWFYTDVLGLQQIRRPNFDRHGAWLTMGNIELHLILGIPVVPSGKDLIVGHISLETTDIGEVLRQLKMRGVPFQTNVSVPKGDESEGIVTQFFLRDPDGYYIEICNCDILTDFCLGSDKVHIEGYEESGTNVANLQLVSKMVALAARAKKRVSLVDNNTDDDIKRGFDDIIDYQNIQVDEEKLANLVRRTNVYGDVVQGETEQSLRVLLQKSENDVPKLIEYLICKHRYTQVFQPPTVYQDDDQPYKPPLLRIEKKTHRDL